MDACRSTVGHRGAGTGSRHLPSVLEARRGLRSPPPLPPLCTSGVWPLICVRGAAKAKQQGTQGPRVLIVGPPDSGKSTVARLLLAYAARMFWKPTLVDMDLGAGFIGVPGAFGAAVVEAPLALRGAIGDEKALMYYYGSMQPEHNDKLRATLMAQLAAAINERMEANPDERASGCMMNTGAWHGAGDKAFVLEMIEMFAVDVVIVLNQRIFRDLEAVTASRLRSISRFTGTAWPRASADTMSCVLVAVADLEEQGRHKSADASTVRRRAVPHRAGTCRAPQNGGIHTQRGGPQPCSSYRLR